MRQLISRVLASSLASLFAVAVFAQAAPDSTAAPVPLPSASAPAGFIAQAEPRPDESNAQRAKSQPGNNAPFWRSVHDSGTNKGVTNLPGAELGVLIQEFVQIPGMRLTNAGEAWRQMRNQWVIPYGGSLLAITLLG